VEYVRLGVALATVAAASRGTWWPDCPDRVPVAARKELCLSGQLMNQKISPRTTT
jgi:hypothetical protein